MEVRRRRIGKYFNKSAINLIKSKFIFFIIALYEIYDLTICLLNQENAFFYLNKNSNDVRTRLNNFLLKISPYLKFSKNRGEKQTASYDSNYNIVIIYFALFVLFYIYLFFGTDNIHKEKQDLGRIPDKLFINFFDFILFRLAPLYGLDSIFRCIFNITAKDHINLFNIVMQIIFVCVLFFVFFTHIFYIWLKLFFN